MNSTLCLQHERKGSQGQLTHFYTLPARFLGSSGSSTPHSYTVGQGIKMWTLAPSCPGTILPVSAGLPQEGSRIPHSQRKP